MYHHHCNTQDGAHLDIVANGLLGGSFERAFFDVWVFNPFALSVIGIMRTYAKKWQYENRIKEVEHSTFTLFVSSTTGSLGPAAGAFNT